jgi:hypothetical protein
MAGGLMQLIPPTQPRSSRAPNDTFLTGNPSKSLFKATFRQCTPFSPQHFRVDFDGAKTLRVHEPSRFEFKLPRYADLVTDAFVCVTLPHIWSPLFPPQQSPSNPTGCPDWAPYEFQWIDYIGIQLISQVQILSGGLVLQEYSGDYLLASWKRDCSDTEWAHLCRLVGHVPELVDPANAFGRVNTYPHAIYDPATQDPVGPEPSIRGRVLTVPLGAWFSQSSRLALPLVALPRAEIQIVVTFRPLMELFRIRDVTDATHQFPLVAPNGNEWTQQAFRFLQPPPTVAIGRADYVDTRMQWNADIHLMCRYVFLSDEERRQFAQSEPSYVFRQVREQRFLNVTGSSKVELESLGRVASLLWYGQRSDVNVRNEWSNWTAWPYAHLPCNAIPPPSEGLWTGWRQTATGELVQTSLGPAVQSDGTPTGFYVTPRYAPENDRSIFVTWGLLLDGEYREQLFPAWVYNHLEPYRGTRGSGHEGLYVYSLEERTSRRQLEPTGFLNTHWFRRVELEFTTLVPPLDPLAQSLTICDPVTGVAIGVNKPTWRIHEYAFDLVVFQEQWNELVFSHGQVGLRFAS